MPIVINGGYLKTRKNGTKKTEDKAKQIDNIKSAYNIYCVKSFGLIENMENGIGRIIQRKIMSSLVYTETVFYFHNYHRPT